MKIIPKFFPVFQIRYYKRLWDVIKHSAFVNNLLSVSGATIIGNLIGLIVLGYSARVLGPEEYGVTVQATSIVAYAGIILSPGLIRWGTREIAQNKAGAGKTLVLVNSTQFILACVGFICLFFYSFYYEEHKWFLVIMLYGFSLFVSAINTDWVCYGLELSRIVAWLSTVNSAIGTIGLLIFIKNPAHLYRMPLLAIIPPTIVTMILYYILIKKYKVTIQLPTMSMYSVSLVASIPLGLASAITVIYTYANNFFIQANLGVTSVGIYNVSVRLVQLTMSFMPILSVVILPRISRLAKEDKNKAKLKSLLYLRISMTIALWITPIIFLHADQIVNIIYGANYADAGILLRIMCLAIIFQTASYCYGGNLIVFKKNWVTLVSVFVIGTAAIVGGAFLIPRIGLMGAAWCFISINVLSF